MIKDWPETRRIVEVLAQERGFTIEAVAEEMEKDRRMKRSEVLPVLKGEEMSNGLHLGLLIRTLALGREESIRFIKATLADVDASLGRPPWSKVGHPI